MMKKHIDEFSKEELVKLIHKFANDPYLQLIKERDKTMSVMEIYGVNRKENNHSDFLDWLFDSSADHKLSAMPANKFMRMLAVKSADSLLNLDAKSATKDDEEQNLSSDELLAFLTGSNEVLDSRTYREVSGEKGRTDIIFELTTRTEPHKIRVVFENKITAPETGGDQTVRYYGEYSKKDGYKNIYVFNSSKRSVPQCPKFVCTAYQDIVDYVIDPLLILPDISDRTKFILKDYILALEKSASVDKVIDKLVMAIGNDTKKLLTDFWENNSELISMMAESLAVLYPENENFSKIAQAADDARKKYRLIFKGQEYTSLSAAGESVIDEISEMITSVDDLKKIDSRKNRFCKATEEFYVNNKGRFGTNAVMVNGEEYFFRKEWVGDTFKTFLMNLVKYGFIESADVHLYETTNNVEMKIYPHI